MAWHVPVRSETLHPGMPESSAKISPISQYAWELMNMLEDARPQSQVWSERPIAAADSLFWIFWWQGFCKEASLMKGKYVHIILHTCACCCTKNMICLLFGRGGQCVIQSRSNLTPDEDDPSWLEAYRFNQVYSLVSRSQRKAPCSAFCNVLLLWTKSQETSRDFAASMFFYSATTPDFNLTWPCKVRPENRFWPEKRSAPFVMNLGVWVLA